MSQVLLIGALVDGQRLGRFNVNVLLWSFLVMVSDGFDLASLASAAPELARTWHVPARSFAAALSASAFGILIGAPLLGIAGDRFGRRPLIIAGCVAYGLGKLATVWATNLDQVAALRFLTGIGLGGLMPNTIALNSELAPRRLRATLIVLMFTGITMGGGIPGYVQAWLIPEQGWQVMFWIGGIGPLVVASCLLFTLPESVDYLVSRPTRGVELLATVRRMRRDLTIADSAQFAVESVAPARGTGFEHLFEARLVWITPLLWICFAAALMANFFLNSWLPLIFDNSGLTARQGGMATSLYHYSGMLGGLLVSLVLGRFGFAVIAVLFALAVPAIAAAPMVMGLIAARCVAGLCRKRLDDVLFEPDQKVT